MISLPQFEITTNEVRLAVRQTKAHGEADLDRIALIGHSRGGEAGGTIGQIVRVARQEVHEPAPQHALG